MSIKRLKILIFMSVLVIAAFYFCHLGFQMGRTHPVPQIPSSFPVPDKINESPLVGNNLEKDIKVISSQPLPSQPILSQPEESDPGPDVPFIADNQANPVQLNNDKPDKSSSLSDMSPKIFKILLWTDFFTTKNYIQDENWKPSCDYTNCNFTSDRDVLQTADAFIFHARDLKIDDLPGSRKPEQRWILLNHESPHHTSSHLIKSLNGLINWTATYRLDSDFQLSPSFIPSLTVLPQPDINHERSGVVSWMVSNCQTPSNREAYVEELAKYIPIDIYGACGNLSCLPKMSDQCYKTLAEKYYFYLSFENSICPDYVTEKFYYILENPIVPVVFGGAVYKKMAPTNSFIDALSYESPKQLAEYLKYLLHNPNDYDSFFNWKRFYTRTSDHYACKICKALNTAGDSKKTWDNLSDWWFVDAPCSRWENGKLIKLKTA